MIRFRFLNAVFWLCMAGLLSQCKSEQPSQAASAISALPLETAFVDDDSSQQTLGVAQLPLQQLLEDNEPPLPIPEYEELDQPLPDNEAAPIFVQPFDLKQTDEAIELVEGDAKGSDLPISIERLNGFDGVVSLNVETETPTDTNGLTLSLTKQSMVLGESTSTINAKLDISALPRLPEERRIIITANSDEYSEQVVVTLQITPVQRDDIYLLIGQSNMVGVSEDQAKEAAPGQADEPNTRIIQANVSVNNEKLIANNKSFIDVQSNFVSPFFTLADCRIRRKKLCLYRQPGQARLFATHKFPVLTGTLRPLITQRWATPYCLIVLCND